MQSTIGHGAAPSHPAVAYIYAEDRKRHTLVQFVCAEIAHRLAPAVISTVPALWSPDARRRYFPGID